MTIDIQPMSETAAQRVWNVADFCRRYRLDSVETERLRRLLGDFASQTELLMNAKRPAVFR